MRRQKQRKTKILHVSPIKTEVVDKYIFNTLTESCIMKEAVVMLERLTKEEIDFHTRRRRGRPGPERKKKTEASRNLRGVERVDFSLYEDYRQSRKSYVKKKEKRKRSHKSPANSEKASRKKSKITCPKEENKDALFHGVPLKDLGLKPTAKKVKSKKVKVPDCIPKPKKKLRRVVPPVSDSDSDIESYGLFYAEKNPQVVIIDFNDSPGFINSPPSQYLANIPVPQAMAFPNLILTSADNDCDDILSALAIGPDDLQLQNQLNSISNANSFPSKSCDTSANVDEKVSAITSKLIESVQGDYFSEHSSEQIAERLDVVGNILNLMDSSFISKAKVPNTVTCESLVSLPQQLPDVKKTGIALNTETIPQKLSKAVASDDTLDNPLPMVKLVVNNLVKKVCARNKRNISFKSKESDKCDKKKCSLCNHPFTQVKNETHCGSCKTYALNQLTSGSKSSNCKRSDKPIEQPIKEKVTSLLQKSTLKPIPSQKSSTKCISSQEAKSKPVAPQKINKYISGINSNSPQHFRSTILLSSPLKSKLKKSPTKSKLKKSPMKSKLKKSPIKCKLKKSPVQYIKLSPKKKRTPPLNLIGNNGSQKKRKTSNIKVLKNFTLNERHRILYKNNTKTKLCVPDDNEVKNDDEIEATGSISSNCTLNPAAGSLCIKPIKPTIISTESGVEEEYWASTFSEALSNNATKLKEDENADFSSSNEEQDESQSNIIRTLKNETTKTMFESSSEGLHTLIKYIKSSGKTENGAADNNVTMVKLKTSESLDNISPQSIDSMKESGKVSNCNSSAAASIMFMACQKETKADSTCVSNINTTQNNKVQCVVSKIDSATLNNHSLLPVVPASLLQKNIETLLLNPLSQAFTIIPVSATNPAVTNSTPVITVLPVPAVSCLKTNQIDVRETVSCFPVRTFLEKNNIPVVLKPSDNIPSASPEDQQVEKPPVLLSTPSASGTVQQKSQTVPSQQPNLKWPSLKADSGKNLNQIVIHELEAFAILSVLDMDKEMDPDRTRQRIERLLRREIACLKGVKNANVTELDEEMAKLVQMKYDGICYRIKSLIVACILWIQCGSLKKVEERVLSKKVSQAISIANSEFESRKFDNDLESWYSRNLVAQAKMEKLEKSDCMFSGNATSMEDNLFSDLANYETNITQSLNNSLVSEPAFIQDSFSDDAFDVLETVLNPKLETSNSCMYSSNTVVNSASTHVPNLNYESVPITNTVQSSSATSNLRHFDIPSPLQSPTGQLTHASFNQSSVARINVCNIQNSLPTTLQNPTSQIINQFDGNMNAGGNVPRMSPSVLQSPSPRSLNTLIYNVHNINTPRMSPRSLQSPSAHSFNQMDLNSLLSQTVVASPRRNSRNSTSSVELSVPQMSPVSVKQEKDTLNKSLCPSANNALVPYGFLPTPSPTPPQPIVTQTQLQQSSQNQQLSSLLSAHINVSQSTQPKPHPQQLSPHYASLLRNASYHQPSNGPRSNNQASLSQLLPVLLNQSASQVPAMLSQRAAIPSNRVVLPFNSNTQMVNRNIPPNVTIQGGSNPNALANKAMAGNISLQLQNSNFSPSRNMQPNMSLHLQGQNPNLGVNRTLPTNVSMSLPDANNGGNTNYGQQQIPVSNNSLVPVNLQQFLLSGGMSTPTNATRVSNQKNFSNFVVPYSNNSNNFIASQPAVVSQASTNSNNVLFSMLSQSNAYAVNSQDKTNMQPPPPYTPSMNSQNIALSSQASNIQNETHLPSQSLMYCAVCSKPATMRCKQCTKVLYCNASCARIYWHQKHKMECKTTS